MLVLTYELSLLFLAIGQLQLEAYQLVGSLTRQVVDGALGFGDRVLLAVVVLRLPWLAHG